MVWAFVEDARRTLVKENILVNAPREKKKRKTSTLRERGRKKEAMEARNLEEEHGWIERIGVGKREYGDKLSPKL